MKYGLQVLRPVIRGVLVKLGDYKFPYPPRMRDKVDRWRAYKQHLVLNNQLFAHSAPVYTSGGYWRLEPMPTSQQLDLYYETSYWFARGQPGALVSERDLAHLRFLTESDVLAQATNGQPAFLNFGSGHGGISYVMRMLGFDITNIDQFPSDQTWFRHLPNLSLVDGPIHIAYASHSLEHVPNIESTIQDLLRVLAPGGFLFVEVPNSVHTNYSRLDQNGARVPCLQVPHTHYFQKDFFRTLPLVTIQLGTYRYQGNKYGVECVDDDGEVIRFLGRKSS